MNESVGCLLKNRSDRFSSIRIAQNSKERFINEADKVTV